jgi:hypothetical protein
MEGNLSRQFLVYRVAAKYVVHLRGRMFHNYDKICLPLSFVSILSDWRVIYVVFYDVSFCSIQRRMVWWVVNGELEMTCKEVVVA